MNFSLKNNGNTGKRPKDNSSNEGKFLIETDFLDTSSYFVPVNQDARPTTYKFKIKIIVLYAKAVFPYSHLNTVIDQ